MPKIHPSAIIHESAKLHESVEVGPYCIVSEHVTIGANSRLISHVHIAQASVIGPECVLYPFVSIGQPAQYITAHVSGNVVIGCGNTFRENVTVNAATKADQSTRIGDRNYFMAGSHAGHDCVVGDDCVIVNSAALGGHTEIGNRVTIGGLTGIHQFVRVGDMAMVGACSKAVQDVAPFSLCQGSELWCYGANKVGLRRSGMARSEIDAVHSALNILLAQGLGRDSAIEKIENTFGDISSIRKLLDFARSSKRGLTRMVSMDRGDELV